MFISCRSIGPTGGHNDRNRRTDFTGPPCLCCNGMVFIRAIADGPDEVRKAAREQMRQGADQVKLMVSGGVASPYDPLESLQFTEEEISAAVEEAKAFGRYVLTHAYTPEAITRAVKCGVRTIEHGNLVDAPTARLMAKNDVYMVPNLIAYDAMKRRAKELGMPDVMLEKNDEVLKYGFAELEHCRKAGVKMAYGSDLLGALENEQTGEFKIRGEVMPAIEVIRSATLIGAEVVRQEGKLGTIQPGAYADLLVVDGNPLEGPRPVPGRRPQPVGHHEGRQVPQERAVMTPVIPSGAKRSRGISLRLPRKEVSPLRLAALGFGRDDGMNIAIIKRRAGRWALNGAATVALLYILTPLIFVTWLAFFRQEIPSFPPEGYSLRWFEAIFDQPKFVEGFSLSFQVGVLATVDRPGARRAGRALHLALRLQAARAALQPAADAADRAGRGAGHGDVRLPGRPPRTRSTSTCSAPSTPWSPATS